MKMKHILLLALSFLVIGACKKGEPENPYESVDQTVNNDNPDPEAYPTGSFGWLHGKIFKPTCANSGCHDGTFEPDFRTISSSYHSLVNQAVVGNDAQFSFEHRVIPGDTTNSFLYARLTRDIETTQGQMPLAAEDDPSWNANSTAYIQAVADWIMDGAPDMMGNPAPSANVNGRPLVYGVAVFPTGNTTTPYPRETDSPFGIGSIMVPPTVVDVWILPFDDNAQYTGFSSIELKASSSLSDFSNAVSSNFQLQGTPLTALDFGGGSSPFYYKTTIDLSSFSDSDYVYFRNYLDDGAQSSLTELPNDASNYFWYLLFSLKVQ
ncbi:MAG: hypothetical protein RLZZ77_157 [Bacteroidota bacterium]|jgi:hypothetical protein